MAEDGLKIFMFAGPNGAGKSTFAREYLPNEANCPLFVNVDLIAAGISPFAPEKAALRAGRVMLAESAEHLRRQESFGVETPLAGRSYVRMIAKWQAKNYTVHLIFLKLDSLELAIERVAARVAQGGHNVPEPVIARRFIQGWQFIALL